MYPFKLCRAILEGCRNQLRKDGKLRHGVQGMQCIFEEDQALLLQPCDYYDALTGEKLDGDEADAAEKVFNVTKLEATFKDFVIGQALEPVLVKAARKLGM